MAFNKQDISRDEYQLLGALAHRGYDWWWHSFTGYDAETGAARPFFIEFFLCNPALGGEKPLFGQLDDTKPSRPSYLMVKAGAWCGTDKAQLHRFFAWKNVDVSMEAPFSVSAADCRLSETELCGSVAVAPDESRAHPEWMCDSGTMSWNLKINKRVAFNVGYGASRPMRRWQLFEMFWHAEGMKSAFEGEVLFNGRRYLVRPDDCFGYADKNWGRDFTSPWVWISSCNLTSELTGLKLNNSVFDIGGGRPKVGPLALPRQLLSAFWYEGREFEYNFSKFWTGCRTKFDCRETETQILWHVEQHTWRSRMVTDIVCDKADMLLVNYESPDGLKRHNRLWNGGNGRGLVQLFSCGRLIDRIRVENAGCEYGEYDAV